MYPVAMKRYMLAVEVLAGGLLVVFSVTGWEALVSNWGAFLVMGILSLIASLFPVKMIRGNGHVSVQLPVIFASAIILGPALGLWLGALCSINLREVTGEVKRPSMVFNRAQFGLVAWAAAELFHLTGGSIQHLTLASASLPLAVSGIVTFFLNMLLVMLAVKYRIDRSLYEVWRVYFKWATLNFWAMLPIGYLMAAVYQNAGVLPEFLFLIPLGLSRWIFTVFHVVRRFYRNTVHIMLTAMDAKDPYTRGHSVRVARYAAILARFMKVPEDEVEEIERTAALHDVGKMAIPDAILNKPTELTISETLVIQRHPLLGNSMLSQIEGMGCARDWILHHHERWDGEGYPHHLEGEQIPLGARIVAVVDTYDAMTSSRPYRQALPHAVACAEIATVAGTQLDPTVVTAFMKLVEQVDLPYEASLARDFESYFEYLKLRSAPA